MEKVRMGVVGVGGMGGGHCKFCKEIKEIELTAVCDNDKVIADKVGAEHGVKAYTDYREMVDSGDIDAVIVATPHYFHPPISIYAMKKGLHVLSEKPIAVTVRDADAMIKTAKKTRRVFAVMFQYRSMPVYRTARKLIDDGKLGKIYRTLIIMSWYRTQAYYGSASWRATWRGEGGGVLMNQAPHLMDIFTWLGGVPSKVKGVVMTRRHKIEVEDESCALLEYPNGATGYIFASVNEVPNEERIEIAGEKGKIIIDSRGEKMLQFASLKNPIQDFTVKSDSMWGGPQAVWKDVKVPEKKSGHAVIIRNFARSILFGEKLLAPGKEAIGALELSNAMILSGKTGKEVKIPVSRKAYDDLLKQLCRKYSGKKKLKETKRITDPSFGK